ncbi:MAG: serine/threonine protein kinase [Alphaproteobacteria bacterium]|nr:serine/threonine protein kinase [Alphaproteobacteria bacterium]
MTDVQNRIGMVLSERYKLTAHVSQELLGNVYAGRDVVRNSPVLVKILHEHLGEGDARFGRFLREVRASSMVRHVNTIEMLDSGADHGLHYIVMEHFAARTLEEELAGGPLPFHRVAHIAAQIASAIGAAHQENVTHRALSPRNILLLTDSPRGDFVKVRDFGLSKLERFNDDDEGTHLTEAGVHVGNTAYMAPEYIERDRFHPKGDLYALGCLMMTMLTGQPPFTGIGAEVLGDHVASPPPRPRDRRPDVPAWLDDLVVELLAKRPEDRPGAYQVVQRLEEGIGHKLEPPGLGPEVKPIASEGPAAPRKTGDDGLPTVVVALVAMALAGIAATMAVLLVGVVVVAFTFRSAPAPTYTAPPPAPRDVPVTPPVAPDPVPRTPSTEPDVEPANFVEPARRSEVKVTCNRRALVVIDGTPRGTTPHVEPVLPGVHRVVVMLPGQPETKQEKRISVNRGEQSWVVFTY